MKYKGFTKKQLLDIYYKMALSRRLDDKQLIMLKQGKGYFHIGASGHEAAQMAAAKNFSHLYISIDIDAVDPAFAPGTGYPEPAGLTSRQLLHMLHRLKNLKNINIIDIVEVNPKKDINNMTSKLAAKILVELNVTN